MKHLVSIVAAAIAVTALPARADCLDDAATFHRVNPRLLRVIAQHESGMRPTAVNRNSNGSEDIGLMQINTSWLPTLARYGIRREHLEETGRRVPLRSTFKWPVVA